MFLSLAYCIFVAQIVTITTLILPLPIKVRETIARLCANTHKHTYLRPLMFMLFMLMAGLFCENILTSWKCESLRLVHNDGGAPLSLAGKHENMEKLYRAQRNMYLTFSVVFNWIVLYGICGLINSIYESTVHKKITDAVEAYGKDCEKPKNQ